MRYTHSIATYIAVVVGFMIWAAVEPESGAIALIAFAALVAVHPIVGFVIGRWSAVLLVLLLPIIALPVPTPENAYEPIPWWFVMLYWGVPAGLLLISAGVGGHKLWNRLRPPEAR